MLSIQANTCGLVLDFTLDCCVAASQRWVLAAMRVHGQDLVRLLWRILGNEQDVCDAYQDTFLKIAHCRQGRKPRHLKAYPVSNGRQHRHQHRKAQDQ